MDRLSLPITDRELFDDLSGYLEDKKSGLKVAVLQALKALSLEEKAPELAYPKALSGDLNDLLDGFHEKWSALSRLERNRLNRDSVIGPIENSLWNIVDILETMSREIFIRLHRIGVDRSSQDTYEKAQASFLLLEKNIELLSKWTARLDTILKNRNGPLSIFTKSRWRIDPDIQRQLKIVSTQLGNGFSEFTKVFIYFLSEQAKQEVPLTKFENYLAICALSERERFDFKRLYSLLKMAESAKKKGLLFQKWAQETIDGSFPREKVVQLFRKYLLAIEKTLFAFVRKMKRRRDPGDQAHLVLIRSEAHTLGASLERFSDFIRGERYSASWLGRLFEGWGKSTLQPDRVMESLVYDVEWLDQLLENQFNLLEQGALSQRAKEREMVEKLQRALHELCQPLLSRSALRKNEREFLLQLKEMKEATLISEEVTEVITDALLKAFSVEGVAISWVGQLPFQELLRIHIGMQEPSEDLDHLTRMELLATLQKRARDWKGEIRALEAIQHDIYDLQQAYQEFYHGLLTKASPVMKNQILQERVAVFELLAFLKEEGNSFGAIRDSLSFLDNYFEAIQIRLSEELSSQVVKIPEG